MKLTTVKQVVFSIFIITLIASIFIKKINAKTLLYKITISNKELNRETIINKSGNGYIIKTLNLPNKDESIFNTDLSFSILQWNINSSEKGTDISVKRVENIILVTGQIRDKKINEKLEIDNLPWYQEWGWGLRNHILSNKDSICFWTLNSNFRQIVKFEVNKEKSETIELNDQKIESVHVKIRLAGALKFLWSGDMWFRKSDGAFLYSKLKDGLAGPVAIMQLIDERN